MMRRISSRGIFVVIALASLWLAGLHAFTREVMSPPAPVSKLTEKADAIVALTGGSNRLEGAFQLLEENLGKKLFISGVAHGVEIRELMEQIRKGNHKDMDCCVVLGFEADNTLGNAHETSAWMRKEGYTSLYLVTANYHMPRAMIAFSRVEPSFKIIPYPVAPDTLDMQNWWRNPHFRSLIIREYSKYLAAFIVYAFPGKEL